MSQFIPANARLASRVILLNEQNRLLLCQGEEPLTRKKFWVMPGGGLEPEETFKDAAARELLEETGISAPIGKHVWYRRHQHLWNGKNADQFEKFFVVRVSNVSQIKSTNPDPYVKKYQWWSIDEIAQSDEEFVPRKIRELLPAIITGDYPNEPIDCGV